MTFKLELKNSQSKYATNAFRTNHFRKTYGTISGIFKYIELEDSKIYVCSLNLSPLTKEFEWFIPESLSEASMLKDTRKSHLCEIFRFEVERINYNPKEL